jgi:hypothetical protein
MIFFPKHASLHGGLAMAFLPVIVYKHLWALN